mmetsp:Transcript_6265/g.14360  ORF Transcript_6265/g.14360 Transcript_6265/m.14360 type:complete len:231 (-) Transcript_6265:1117-1809(-)
MVYVRSPWGTWPAHGICWPVSQNRPVARARLHHVEQTLAMQKRGMNIRALLIGSRGLEGGNVRRPLRSLATDRDPLHCAHVPAELSADHLHRVRGDGLVDCHQLGIVDPVVTLVELRADDVGVNLRHEVLQEGNAGLRVEVATILCGVRDDLVHLVQLLPGNGVRDQGTLVQGLIVRALRLHANGHHLLKRELNPSLDHGNHQHRVVKVLLLGDVHAPRRGLLKVGLGGL